MKQLLCLLITILFILVPEISVLNTNHLILYTKKINNIPVKNSISIPVNNNINTGNLTLDDVSVPVYDDVNSIKLYLYRNIIKSEGYKSTIYKCPAGHLTTGIGHILTTKDTKLKFPISNYQIDSLFWEDLDIRFDIAKQLHPELPLNKQYAITWFIYAYGDGMYKSSLLYKYIVENKDISNIILEYCYYRDNGKLIKSNNLLKILQKIKKLWHLT